MDEKPSMEVEYELTAEDYVALVLYHSENDPRLRRSHRNAVIVLVIYVLGALALGLFGPKGSEMFAIIACPVLLGILAFKTVPSLRKWLLLRRLAKSKDGDTHGPSRMKVALSPEDLSHESPDCSVRHRWSGIHNVVKTDNHLFIFFDSATAFIVPRRAFPSSGDFVTFAAQAEDYLRQAKGGASPAATSGTAQG